MHPATAPVEKAHDIAMGVVTTMRQMGVMGLPRNYEIFYEALTGSNPDLTLGVVSLNHRPSQEELDRIGQKYFARNHEHAIIETAREALARELEDVARLLRRERGHVEKYGEVLTQTSQGLENRHAMSRELLQKIVGAMSVATTSTLDHGLHVAATLSEKSAELESVKSALEEYKLLADTDPLIRIWNRRAFDKRLAAIYNSKRSIMFSALILSRHRPLQGSQRPFRSPCRR
jgi:diguanylate cyclase